MSTLTDHVGPESDLVLLEQTVQTRNSVRQETSFFLWINAFDRGAPEPET